MNLQIKEFNCEKAGFRAIHTENDADRLISCRRIINDAKDGKISAQPHTLVKQICFPNGNVLF